MQTFTSKFMRDTTIPIDDLLNVIPNQVSLDGNNLLTFIPIFEEIKETIFGMDQPSSPGHDGFNGFFVKAWINVGLVVCQVIQSFLSVMSCP